MKKFYGTPRRIQSPVIGIITKNDISLLKRPGYILTGQHSSMLGYSGIISSHPAERLCLSPGVFNVNEKDLEQLNDGDIVYLENSGTINILWEANSTTNSILVTERCNCNCLMCPQPPKDDYRYQDIINTRLLELLNDSPNQPICLTGGEPTLNKKQFIKYLRTIKTQMPSRAVDVLTNAQPISDFDYAQEIFKNIPSKTTFCISLHSDTSDLHNSITKTKNGFYKTIQGIHNLAILGIPVELRFVITKMNYKRIPSFAKFVQRNFPFVVHVAYMSLETTGYAETNMDSVWIDPVNYQDELSSATKFLSRAGLAVSIYNTPLCLLNRDCWDYARQSISMWKNSYPDTCNSCIHQNQCCGIFTTSSFISPNINPYTQLEV